MEFAAYEGSEVSKFKVGDRVVVIDEHYYRLYNLTGIIRWISEDTTILHCTFGYKGAATPIEEDSVIQEHIYNSPLYKALS